VIKVGKVLFEATEELEREKGIPRDAILKSIIDAMVTAYKKHVKGTHTGNISGYIDDKKGEIGIYRTKEVVEEEVFSEHTEVLLEEARKVDPNCEVGDEVQIEVTPGDFGRVAAQAAKQVITQRIREAERKLILDEFMDKKGTLVTGVVRRFEPRNVIVNIGKTDAILPQKEQIPGEYYRMNDRIRVYVLDVKETTKLPQVILSQIHPRLVQELFELEVPEIEDGIVEIKSISREAGYRTKIAVGSTDPNVDPVGACIGPRGSRIQTIVNELKNEKIDIVRYTENPAEYISNALSPARIISVDILENSENTREALVVVPNDQLSLAIGKEGQNVRLAHRLTGWKIDIKSLSQYEQMREEYEQQYGQQGYDEYAEGEYSEEYPQEFSEQQYSENEDYEQQPEESNQELSEETVEEISEAGPVQEVVEEAAITEEEIVEEKPKKVKKTAKKDEASEEPAEEKPKKAKKSKNTEEETVEEKPKKAKKTKEQED
jgi:N utilization substance protein A